MNTTKHRLQKWKGDIEIDTYGGKPLISKNNKPVFAEIYVLEYFREKGYDGFWIDNYRRRLGI